MLARAKSSPGLALILAAFMAWPANVSLFASPDRTPVTLARPDGQSPVRPTIGRVDRDAQVRWADLALVADDREESDGPKLPPAVLGMGRSDLPSLVPASPVGRSAVVLGRPASMPRSPRLRC